MELSELQTSAELISIDQALIDRQPLESQRLLLLIIMALVQLLLDLLRNLQGTNTTLKQTDADLRKELQELNQPRKTPRNSSLPPSTEHPHSKPKSSRQPTGKPTGGQLGHPRHERPLIPNEECEPRIALPAPDFCRRCGAPLDEHDCQVDPLRHQAWDIP